MVSAEDVYDEGDLTDAGWFVVTMPGDEDSVAHLHSVECLVEWATVAQKDGIVNG